jgi:hypothetical protein
VSHLQSVSVSEVACLAIILAHLTEEENNMKNWFNKWAIFIQEPEGA